MLYIKEDATNDLQELASAKPTPRVQPWYDGWHGWETLALKSVLKPKLTIL